MPAPVRVTNVNGNSATATHEYSVDSAAPTVTINTIASDNIINASEAAAGVTVSGTSTAQTGQTLTVTLNGTNYQTTVKADGSWSLTLPASDLTALANNGYTLTATVSDQAVTRSASKGVTVDTTAPVISFNTVAGDDVINNVEHTQAQIISGTATGAVAGDRRGDHRRAAVCHQHRCQRQLERWRACQRDFRPCGRHGDHQRHHYR